MPRYTTLPIWDTPHPPRLADCRFYDDLPRECLRFRTANLDKVQGITFFYMRGYLYGIYAHTSTDSCALDTYKRFDKRSQPPFVWVYLPIAPHDRIDGIGVRIDMCGNRPIMVSSKVFSEMALTY